MCLIVRRQRFRVYVQYANYDFKDENGKTANCIKHALGHALN